MRNFLINIIKLYQRTLSPDTGIFKHNHPGGYCKYSPTCSQYCIDAISKYGIIKGVLLGIKRIFRCNPWSKGGYDPVN